MTTPTQPPASGTSTDTGSGQPQGAPTGQQGAPGAPNGQPPAQQPAPGTQPPAGTTSTPTPPAAGSSGDGSDTDLSQLTPEQLAAEVQKWRVMSRKHEANSKKGQEAADELKKLKDAQLTQQERDTQALTEARDKLAAYELKEFRTQAAEAAGLPTKWAARMTATTAADAIAEARELKADLDELTAGQQAPQGPPNLRQGQRGAPANTQLSGSDLIRHMAGYGHQ